MALESDADRRAMLSIDGVAVRIYPGGSPVDRVAQYDGPSEAIQGGFDGGAEVIETAPALYMIATDLAGVVIGDRIVVLEGPGSGDFQAVKVERQEDGAFSRVALARRV